jgi:hypothetical protein
MEWEVRGEGGRGRKRVAEQDERRSIGQKWKWLEWPLLKRTPEYF